MKVSRGEAVSSRLASDLIAIREVVSEAEGEMREVVERRQLASEALRLTPDLRRPAGTAAKKITVVLIAQIGKRQKTASPNHQCLTVIGAELD